jgi:hypothetical protein
VEFNFPDALTTWRTTIRGMTDDGKAGGVVTRVLVRKNLIVRLAAPRFFRQGDEVNAARDCAQLPGDGQGRDVCAGCDGLEVMAANAESEYSGQGRELCGLAREGARDGQRRADGQGADERGVDALEMTLPVLAYGVKQRAQARGSRSPARDRVSGRYSYPPGSDAGTRGLTITVAPSVAGTVFDALDYLTGIRGDARSRRCRASCRT